MSFESLLTALYATADDWWRAKHPPSARGPGRPALLSESEVLILAIAAQWPRFRSERDFWRYAEANLRPYFPTLCSHSRFNRRARELEPELRALQRHMASLLL